MSTPQQAGVVLRALEFGRLPAPAVIRWVDTTIAAEPTPPQWLLDLSLLNPAHFADMLHVLREHAECMESRELDVCILAHLYFACQISIRELFERAFEACITEYEAPDFAPFNRLADVLCDWDQMGFPDPSQGDLRQRVSEALAECQRACGELPKFVSVLYAD
jgi:hypothetical protein